MHDITVLTRSEPCSVPLETLQKCAPDLARAFANDFREALTFQLDWSEHEAEVVRIVVSWMKAKHRHETAQTQLLARDEAFAGKRPLESLSQHELARLFAHKGLSTTDRPQLLTMASEEPLVQRATQGYARAQPSQPLVRRTPAKALDPRKGWGRHVSAEYETRADTADGHLLSLDVLEDASIFAATYSAYRASHLLRMAHQWRESGVSQRALADPAELAAQAEARAALEAERASAAAAMDAASDAATSDAAVCLGTLRLALYLSLDELVRAAVAAVGDALDADNAVSLLGLADELACFPLKERVSGFLVAHMDQVAPPAPTPCSSATPLSRGPHFAPPDVAQIVETAHWRDAVAPHEQQRLLTLALAARANPLGLGLGRDAMHDARELVAVAAEALLQQKERHAEAEAALAQARPGEGADHAARMLSQQRERITLLEAYVHAQRADLERRAPTRAACVLCAAAAGGSGATNGGGSGGGGGEYAPEVGDRVKAHFGVDEDEAWFPGTVHKVRKDGSVDVAYDDGDFEKRKPLARVRPLPPEEEEEEDEGEDEGEEEEQ